MAQQAPDGSDDEVCYLARLGITPERLTAGSAPVLTVVTVAIVLELDSLREELGVTMEGFTGWLKQVFGEERFAEVGADAGMRRATASIRKTLMACKSKRTTLKKSAAKKENLPCILGMNSSCPLVERVPVLKVVVTRRT